MAHRHAFGGGSLGSAGFTLLETLVAMMILSISLTVVFQLFSGGLRSARVSGDYTHAVFKAREKMEEILLQPRLVEGTFQGRFDDRYRWRAEISPVEEADEGNQEPKIRPMSVLLDVLWDSDNREKRFTIRTIALTETGGEQRGG